MASTSRCGLLADRSAIGRHLKIACGVLSTSVPIPFFRLPLERDAIPAGGETVPPAELVVGDLRRARGRTCSSCLSSPLVAPSLGMSFQSIASALRGGGLPSRLRWQLVLRSPLCAALSTATSGRIAFLATRVHPRNGCGKPVLSIPMALLTIGRRVAGGSRVSGALLWLLAVPAIVVDGAFRRRAALCAPDRLDPTATCLTRASHIAALLPGHSIGRIAAIGDCADLDSGRLRRRATDFQVR
jgi:hypothetical protein